MSDIEVKKEKKPRSEAQLAHTKKLVALNKKRAEDRKAGKAPPLQKKKKVSIKIKKEKPIYKAPPLVNDGLESEDDTDESQDFSDEEYSLAQALYQESLDNEDPDFVDTPPEEDDKEDIKADSPVSHFSTSKKKNYKKRKVYR